MRDKDRVVAIVCADIHLTLRPPRARRHEPDWFEAMARPLNEIGALASHYDVPVLCAGDVFDHWRAEPELVNFAINHLPRMYAIPGQHDLPLHNLELMKRSAYWTLVLAQVIEPVIHGVATMISEDVVVHGFPWGKPIRPLKDSASKKMQVALVHDYFWVDGHCFPGAPREHESRKYLDRVKGYDAVIFGDNHRGFMTVVGGVMVLNCGTLMRRKTDEAEYEPQVGLLCRSGNIITHKLNTNCDKFERKEEDCNGTKKSMELWDMKDFVRGLGELEKTRFDFVQAIEYAMTKRVVSDDIRRIILEALGRG